MIAYVHFLLLLLTSSSVLYAQTEALPDSIEVHFIFELDGSRIVLGESVVYNGGAEMVQVDRLRFYISNMRWEGSAPELLVLEESSFRMRGP
jgi:hypothetical protein